jgi:hypothetical protein
LSLSDRKGYLTTLKPSTKEKLQKLLSVDLPYPHMPGQ